MLSKQSHVHIVNVTQCVEMSMYTYNYVNNLYIATCYAEYQLN